MIFFNIDGFLVTKDFEKAFDSLNHSFLHAVLKKFGFGTSFINWIEAILNKFLFSAYADDSTFLLRNIDSVIELARIFK